MWYWEEKGLFLLTRDHGNLHIPTYLTCSWVASTLSQNLFPYISTLAEKEQTSSGLIQYFASIEIAQDFHLWVCLFLNHKNKRNPSNSLSLGRTLSIQIISDKRRMGAA